MRLLRKATSSNPALTPFVLPIIIIWITFIVLSWTAAPLSNFILSQTSVGKRLIRGWLRTTMSIYTGVAAIAAASTLFASISVARGGAGVALAMSILGTWLGVFLASRKPAC